MIEIAKNEDWRAWIGEILLASKVSGFWGVCLVLFNEDEEFVRNLLGLVKTTLKLKENDLFHIILKDESAVNVDLATQAVESYLKRIEFVYS